MMILRNGLSQDKTGLRSMGIAWTCSIPTRNEVIIIFNKAVAAPKKYFTENETQKSLKVPTALSDQCTTPLTVTMNWNKYTRRVLMLLSAVGFYTSLCHYRAILCTYTHVHVESVVTYINTIVGFTECVYIYTIHTDYALGNLIFQRLQHSFLICADEGTLCSKQKAYILVITTGSSHAGENCVNDGQSYFIP